MFNDQAAYRLQFSRNTVCCQNGDRLVSMSFFYLYLVLTCMRTQRAQKKCSLCVQTMIFGHIQADRLEDKPYDRHSSHNS